MEQLSFEVAAIKNEELSLSSQLYEELRKAHPDSKSFCRNYALNYSELLAQLCDCHASIDLDTVLRVRPLLSRVRTIEKLCELFLTEVGFVEFLDEYVLSSDTLLLMIYRGQRWAVGERMAMLAHYPQFVKCVRNPLEFVSFAHLDKNISRVRFEELAAKVHTMSYAHILRETRAIVEDILAEYPRDLREKVLEKKVRHIGNIWLVRMRGCLTDPSLQHFFADNMHRYPIPQILETLRSKKKCHLEYFRDFVSLEPIHRYIEDNLVKHNAALKTILEDAKIKPKNKLVLVQRYPTLLSALYEPDKFRGWRESKGREESSCEFSD